MILTSIVSQKETLGEKKLLSRDCDGCSHLMECRKRYRKVAKGEKVYCPDGTAHLVDESNICQSADLYSVYLEAFQ
jgi:hypothetical protein